MSTQAMRLCVEQEIGVHWLTTTGYHTASLTPTAGLVQRRLRQYRALSDETVCLRLTRALVLAKIEGQHRYLLRATRGNAPPVVARSPDRATHDGPKVSGVARSGDRAT